MKQVISQDSNGVTVGYDHDRRSLYCSFEWKGTARAVYDADFDNDTNIPLYARISMERIRKAINA